MAAIKILSVDDEAPLELLMRQYFRRKIRNGEYEFFFAHNGLEALSILYNNPDIEIILSENIGLQNLCFVYVLKRGGGPAELCQIYDWLNGSDSGNMALAKTLFEQARTLSFMTT